MKIRTQEDLCDYLSSAIAWRKKELVYLKQTIEATKHTSPRCSMLIRCGVTLLYAHYEGFIKQASQAYLEYVASKRLTLNAVSSNFCALSIWGSLSSVADSRKASAFGPAAKLFQNASTEKSHIPYKTAIDTESNLSSTVLKEIVWTLGLDYSAYETKERIIDEKLLAKRNKIAHGEYLDVDKNDYAEIFKAILEIIENFQTQIENAVQLERFRRFPSASP